MIRILVVLPLFFLISCATIFTGTTDNVSINSDPEGAEVSINGIDRGKTPVVVKLSRSANPIIQMKKEGYEKEIFTPEEKFNSVSALNLICVLCWLIDGVSGAWHKYDPVIYDIDLDPAKS